MLHLHSRLSQKQTSPVRACSVLNLSFSLMTAFFHFGLAWVTKKIVLLQKYSTCAHAGMLFFSTITQRLNEYSPLLSSALLHFLIFSRLNLSLLSEAVGFNLLMISAKSRSVKPGLARSAKAKAERRSSVRDEGEDLVGEREWR